MTTRRSGRPRLDDNTAAKAISIQGKHLAMLDAAIAQRDGRTPEFIADVTAETGAYDERTDRAIAKRRRDFLGELIERHCSTEALHPTEIRVVAPMRFFGTAKDMDAAVAEVLDWQRTEGARLTAEAPEPVQAAMRHAQLERLKREDPEGFAIAMDDLRRRMLTGGADHE